MWPRICNVKYVVEVQVEQNFWLNSGYSEISGSGTTTQNA